VRVAFHYFTASARRRGDAWDVEVPGLGSVRISNLRDAQAVLGPMIALDRALDPARVYVEVRVVRDTESDFGSKLL
jgi:hypothetical protein